jgi:hypothetical protein
VVGHTFTDVLEELSVSSPMEAVRLFESLVNCLPDFSYHISDDSNLNVSSIHCTKMGNHKICTSHKI